MSDHSVSPIPPWGSVTRYGDGAFLKEEEAALFNNKKPEIIETTPPRMNTDSATFTKQAEQSLKNRPSPPPIAQWVRTERKANQSLGVQIQRLLRSGFARNGLPSYIQVTKTENRHAHYEKCPECGGKVRQGSLTITNQHLRDDEGNPRKVALPHFNLHCLAEHGQKFPRLPSRQPGYTPVDSLRAVITGTRVRERS